MELKQLHFSIDLTANDTQRSVLDGFSVLLLLLGLVWKAIRINYSCVALFGEFIFSSGALSTAILVSTAPVSVCASRCDTEPDSRRCLLLCLAPTRTFVRRYLNKHERQVGEGKYLLNKAEQTLIVKFYSNLSRFCS
jgi:hypothetical protein